MKSEYAKTMQDFFKSVEPSIMREPTQLAVAFGNHFWQQERQGTVRNLPATSNSINNVSVLAKETPLSFLTKRVSLVSDVTILTHYREEKNLFFKFDDTPPAPGAPERNSQCYLRCPNLAELGKWLIACKPLLTQGDIFYFPDIFVETISQGYPEAYCDPITYEEEETLKSICDLIIENKKLIDVSSKNAVKSKLIRPILEVDLPHIDGTSLEDFCKITSDERDPAEHFRDLLRSKFLDLEQNEGSESFDTNLTKIGLELRNGVREIGSSLREVSRKRSFQVTGAVVAATTAILVAINSTAWGALPEILGTSGGILGISKALEDYAIEKSKLQESPYYYLWLFSKKVKKASS